jgi:hypothetical protein
MWSTWSLLVVAVEPTTMVVAAVLVVCLQDFLAQLRVLSCG